MIKIQKIFLFVLITFLVSCSTIKTEDENQSLLSFAATKKYYKTDSHLSNQSLILKMNNVLGKLYEKPENDNEILSLVFSELGMAYSNLGMHEISSVYYQKSLDLNPENVEGIYDLAVELSYIGHFPEAESLFNQAIAKSSDASRYWRHLGHLFLINDIQTKAYQSYLQGLKNAKFDSDKQYSSILVMITSEKPIDKTISKLIDTTDKQKWPGPILSYLLKEITEEQLLIEIKTGEDNEVREKLCEALFYIGASHYFSGKPDLANKYFEYVVNLRVKKFVETNIAEKILSGM